MLCIAAGEDAQNAVSLQRVAYPGGEVPSGAPKEEFGLMTLEKKSSLGDRTNVQSTPSAAARECEAWRRNVRRPVYIRLLLQLSLTLACIKALSKTAPNIHGSSHVAAQGLVVAS